MGDVHRLMGAPSRLMAQPEPVRPAKALAVSGGLSLLFLVIYGGCNWISARRLDVATLYFPWEQAIPFVPFFIVPYLSIDLFFIAAPFLCRSERELRTFARRISAVIIGAGLVFLLFPLRYAFARPHAPGWLGVLIGWFQGIDPPHNLLPSLHAALGLLLVDMYFRHSRGAWRGAVIVWFVLIGLSPVLTRQHHLLDIAAGFALAGYCFYFVRDFSPSLALRASPRIGCYYVAGAVGLIIVALLFPPLMRACLWWPILSLLVVAGAYFGWGPGVFRKTGGRLPISSWFVLGPCLAGQFFSFWYYRSRCAAWNEMGPSILLGRRLSNKEAPAACRAGVTAVLDVSAEFSEAEAFLSLSYCNVGVLDLTGPTVEQLEEMGRFIMTETERGRVYVHCKIGYSRSAAAAAAYLMMSGQAAGPGAAISIIRMARPSVMIRPEILLALQEFDTHLHHSESGAAFLLASTGAPVS